MIIKKLIFTLILLQIVLIEITRSQETQRTSEGLKSLAQIDTTIWKYLSATDSSQWTISKEDSERSYRDCFLKGANIYRDVSTITKKIEKGSLTLAEATPDLIKLLEEVKAYFEAGLKLNPFNTYIRTVMAMVYTYLEGLYTTTNDDVKRLQMIQNLLCLEKDQQKRIDLFNKAGNIYFEYQVWEEACQNFQYAVNMIFEGDASGIDTTKLFNNIYLRGTAQLKLYQDEPALTSFSHARMIAPNEIWYTTLTNLIDFINWDKGNIRASEQFQNARRLFSEKKYEDAEEAYLELLKIIQTKKARHEAQLRLSMVQFNYLDKKEEAVDRLWRIVKNFPLDTLTGIATDSIHKDYWEMYCQMCLQLANTYIPQNKKIAFTYFQKISQIECSTRGSAYLNLAIMSFKNPEMCLEYCHHALAYFEHLNKNEKKELYRAFYLVHKTKGNFEEALKWYQKFHEI